MFRIANGFGERNTMMEHNELYRWKITARNQCTEDTVKSYLLMTFTVWFAIHFFSLRPWRINLIDADNDLVHKLQNRKNIYLPFHWIVIVCAGVVETAFVGETFSKSRRLKQ